MFWSKGKLRVPGALLIGIILSTILAIIFGIVPLPEAIISLPPSMSEIAFKLDIAGALRPEFIPFILIFLLGDFLSTTGTTLACGTKAGMVDDQGNLPGLDRVFEVDSTFGVAGAACGVTTITTFVESAAGIEEGGRTGFTSIVVSLFFFAALLFSPIFLMIPPMASGVALIVVGLSMMQELRRVTFSNPVQWVPVLVMVVVTAFSMDFAAGMCAGLIVYSIFTALYRFILRDESAKFNVMTCVLFLIGISHFILNA
jgi:AGZA family xanthine/uracil permease-like MFS transporter